MQTIDGDHIEGKIRAMLDAGYEPHQIGYAIGLDVGKFIEGRRCAILLQSVEADFRTRLAGLRESIRQGDKLTRVGMVLAFCAGILTGWGVA